jgi:hypothetical protein
MKKAMTVILMAAVALFCIPACSEYAGDLQGDLNGDGHLTQKDIELLKSLIQEGSNNEKGDLNDDGRVDNDDLDELKNKVCDANGAARNDSGDCCFTSNDNTVCCDQDYDGDFEECTPPNIECVVAADCALDCPTACVDGKCRCIGACDSNDDCFPLNCPAFCNDLGTCECKVFCKQDDDCAFIGKCKSVCGNAGYCVCDDTTCLGQGQGFTGDPQNHNCCPGLDPIVYAEYWNGECAYVDCLCFVCAACGNGACEDGENPCNCPRDCGECVPGDIRYHYCDNGQKVRWCECGNDATWQCIDSPEVACVECVPGEERLFECPDGTLVPWCTCGDSGDWYCITSPEMACEQNQCLVEGEKFESFQDENPCCAGLVPVPDHFPDNGTCVGPNCPCFICTRCGTDAGVCSLGENRCNCPQDCVGANNCTAKDCIRVPGDYVVSGTCPGIPNEAQMHCITQTDCSLTFSDVLANVLGASGCIDHNVIYTQKGCQGMVTVTGVSRTMGFTCPWANSDGTQSNCTVSLDDMID